jgi:hypothetical protein
MKKPILPRFFATLTLFFLFFIALSVVQFSRQDGFSRKVGNLVVSGKLKKSEDWSSPGENAMNVEIPIEDNASVLFGGLEFMLSGAGKDGKQLFFIDFDEIRRPLIPVSMIISPLSVHFKLSGGCELGFYVHTNGDSDELIISGVFSEDAVAIELPYSLTKNARVAVANNDEITVLLDKKEFAFDRSIIDTKQEFITLSNVNPIVTYRPVTEEPAFNPVECIISGAMDKGGYNEFVTRWSEKAYLEWNSGIALAQDEKLINAFIAEGTRHGYYSESLNNVNAEFAVSARRSYRSAPYFGRLDAALRSFTAAETERLIAITGKIRNNPATLLDSDNDFEFLALRNEKTLFDDGVNYLPALANGANTAAFPAIFEGWSAYNAWRSKNANPFETIAHDARDAIHESLVKDGENLHVFYAAKRDTDADVADRAVEVDTLYNIRLGMGLAAYGEDSGNNEWAGIGRSLILSALSFSDKAGNIPASLHLNVEGAFEASGTRLLNAVDIYEILKVSGFYPHASSIGNVMQGVYLWTASPDVDAAYNSDVLEFNITFPVGGVHHLLIKGLPQFKKIQLRDIDYRSDPQFERYNSPGWAYSRDTKTLLVKLVHRTEVETLKVFY